MRFSHQASSLSATAVALALVVTSACRSKPEGKTSSAEDRIHIPQLHQNNLKQANSNLMLEQASSPIHWQTWSKSVFEDAAKEKNIIFALIASGTDIYALDTLEQLNQSPLTCSTLNKNHVNVLVDANIHPDLQLFVSELCDKSGASPTTPLAVWFSYEGIPISWLPVPHHSAYNAADFIARNSNTVARVWRDSPDYVLKNSRDDFTRRMSAMLPDPVIDEHQLAPVRAMRHAASLFDPTSSTVDGLSQISIARHIELVTTASRHPDVSDTQSKRYIKIATQTADTMLLQGVIDPLDNGVFTNIQSSTSALPVFSKDLRTQAHTAKALYTLYQTSGETRFLDAAENILNYTIKHLSLPDGGYSLGIVHSNNRPLDNPCTWTLEELEATLSPEEMKLCTLAFGIEGLGNIPLVDDRNRAYFRQNTLTWKIAPSALASKAGLTPEAASQTLESLTKKLAKQRTEKSANLHHEKLATTESIALLCSSYVTAYRATGDQQHLDRATKALNYIQKNLTDDSGTLRHARHNGTMLPREATGIDYARLTQASVDLYEVTLDSSWLQLASNTHGQMSKQLGNTLNYQISESNGTAYPYPYAVHQYFTQPPLNNSSTWAIAYSNSKRLASRQTTKPLEDQNKELLGILLSTLKPSPLNGIDFLTEEAKLQQPVVYLKMPVAPEILKTAISQPCQIIAVSDKPIQPGQFPELKNQSSQIPAQGALVLQRGKNLGSAKHAEDLTKLLQ